MKYGAAFSKRAQAGSLALTAPGLGSAVGSQSTEHREEGPITEGLTGSPFPSETQWPHISGPASKPPAPFPVCAPATGPPGPHGEFSAVPRGTLLSGLGHFPS